MLKPWLRRCESLEQLADYAASKGGEVRGQLRFTVRQYQGDVETGDYPTGAHGTFVRHDADGQHPTVTFYATRQFVTNWEEGEMSTSVPISDSLLAANGTFAAVNVIKTQFLISYSPIE